MSDAKGTPSEVVVEITALENGYSVKCVILKQLKMFYSYILKSLKDGKHYYGSCENLEKRLNRHNSGQVRSTKGRIPFVIVFSEKFETRSEAFKREYFYKSIDGYKFLKSKNII